MHNNITSTIHMQTPKTITGNTNFSEENKTQPFVFPKKFMQNTQRTWICSKFSIKPNPITPSVYKIVKHAFKMLQHLLESV